MISMDRKYRTRDGREVRLLCTDAPGKRRVVSLIGSEVYRYYAHGGYWETLGTDHRDLIEVKPERTGWLNMYVRLDGTAYPGVRLHSSKNVADEVSAENAGRIACVPITFRDGDGIDGR